MASAGKTQKLLKKTSLRSNASKVSSIDMVSQMQDDPMLESIDYGNSHYEPNLRDTSINSSSNFKKITLSNYSQKKLPS